MGSLPGPLQIFVDWICGLRLCLCAKANYIVADLEKITENLLVVRWAGLAWRVKRSRLGGGGELETCLAPLSLNSSKSQPPLAIVPDLVIDWGRSSQPLIHPNSQFPIPNTSTKRAA